MAVHSLKDLPTECAAGLCVAAVPPRELPWDALVGCRVTDLAGAGLRIGTSSLRRGAQLRRAFPGCQVVDLRGNIDTRLQRVADGAMAGAVLAAAGLRRLGCADRITHVFPADVMLPAPGQGALAVQTRAADRELRARLTPVHCAVTAACVAAERAFMHALGGGCRAPVAALAHCDGDTLRLRGQLLSVDGTQCLEGELTGSQADGTALGDRLAARLIAAGAAGMLHPAGGETSHE
jgi:hydroxymethylbilane synthase